MRREDGARYAHGGVESSVSEPFDAPPGFDFGSRGPAGFGTQTGVHPICERFLALTFLVLTGLVVGGPGAARAAEAGEGTVPLTDAEKAAGWVLLFDGESTAGWRGFRKSGFPTNGWRVENRCLRHPEKSGGGDIITATRYSAYELRFDWRINAGGNSGVKYFIIEERQGAIGHEYQLLGPRNTAEAVKDLKHATASFYDVLPAGTNALPRSPGEWNSSRIIVDPPVIEHWLNDVKVLSYRLDSDEVKKHIAASKFKEVAGFGTSYPHHVLLQDHGGDIWFKNLKLRPIAAH